MKTIIIIILLTSTVLYSCSGHFFFNYGWNVDGGKVYYKNAFPGRTIEVLEADAKTFKVVFQPGDSLHNSNGDFAVDKDHVFYGGRMIAGSDGKSFIELNREFSKDKNQCYFKGEAIPNADPLSFKVKDELFSVDKNNVYKGTSLMDTSSAVFETFDSSMIAHTTNAVSAFGKIIPLAPQDKFQFLQYNFYAINNQVYFQDAPVDGVTVNGFTALGDFYFKTPTQVYYGDKLIKDANPTTYHLIGGPYGKDTKHVFFFEKIVEGADPATFTIINEKFQCARDKYTIYHENLKIQNVTAEEMANKKECTSCNYQAVYFADK